VTDVVVAQGLSRSYGSGAAAVHAVREAELRLAEGELAVLSGPSGSGKTTLLSLVGGLDTPDTGTITVAGLELARLDRDGRERFRRDVTGWVFQAAGLLPILSSVENVMLPLLTQGRRELEARAAALDALATVGLSERAEHRAQELSGGEQQRVSLARALAKGPRLLIADEPTGELDSETALVVMQLLRGVAAGGTAVLVATHDAAFRDFADQVLLMEDGRCRRAG